jgi:hypothetical protein
VKGHESQGRVLAWRKSYNKRVWHASQGVGLARNPRAFAAINTVRTTAEEEAVQLCKLVVQQREGT